MDAKPKGASGPVPAFRNAFVKTKPPKLILAAPVQAKTTDAGLSSSGGNAVCPSKLIPGVNDGQAKPTDTASSSSGGQMVCPSRLIPGINDSSKRQEPSSSGGKAECPSRLIPASKLSYIPGIHDGGGSQRQVSTHRDSRDDRGGSRSNAEVKSHQEAKESEAADFQSGEDGRRRKRRTHATNGEDFPTETVSSEVNAEDPPRQRRRKSNARQGGRVNMNTSRENGSHRNRDDSRNTRREDKRHSHQLKDEDSDADILQEIIQETSDADIIQRGMTVLQEYRDRTNAFRRQRELESAAQHDGRNTSADTSYDNRRHRNRGDSRSNSPEDEGRIRRQKVEDSHTDVIQHDRRQRSRGQRNRGDSRSKRSEEEGHGRQQKIEDSNVDVIQHDKYQRRHENTKQHGGRSSAMDTSHDNRSYRNRNDSRSNHEKRRGRHATKDDLIDSRYDESATGAAHGYESRSQHNRSRSWSRRRLGLPKFEPDNRKSKAQHTYDQPTKAPSPSRTTRNRSRSRSTRPRRFQEGKSKSDEKNTHDQPTKTASPPRPARKGSKFDMVVPDKEAQASQIAVDKFKNAKAVAKAQASQAAAAAAVAQVLGGPSAGAPVLNAGGPANSVQLLQNSGLTDLNGAVRRFMQSQAGSVRTNVSLRILRPGDWVCPTCNCHNYSTRQDCKHCNTRLASVQGTNVISRGGVIQQAPQQGSG